MEDNNLKNVVVGGDVPANNILPEAQPVLLPVKNWKEKLLNILPNGGFKMVKVPLLAGFLFIVAIALVWWQFSQDKHVAVKQFSNVYSFVPEKISQSAVILINVPQGVSEDIARANIAFSPSVEGSWEVEELANVVAFKPKKPLRTGVYYAVNLDTEAVQMSGDFYVDEDPKIETIFPSSGSETHEDSEITIVFNRPMVPLTTLTAQESLELPITISPPTPGKFKWISTRNLQFIPETTLIPSSQYIVEIGNGLKSLDGLPVAPISHSFITRPLRYENITAEQISYKSPVIISFNQAVDLDKTRKSISINGPEEKKVLLQVEYGKITYYDREEKKQVTAEDKSKLFIYQKEDVHGRDRLWDFDTTYTIKVEGAVPLTGTMNLTEGRFSNFTVPNIVSGIRAESPRASLVEPGLMDPEGTIIVTFFDDIDKNKSDIEVKGSKSIEYGERCKVDENGETIQLGSTCEIESDTKTLIFSFNRDVFSTGEDFVISLKKIINLENFKINADSLTIPLKTYPAFSILKTIPDNQSTSADLDGMTICSNTPLQDPGDAGLDSYLDTTGYIVYGRWSNSVLVDYVDYSNPYYKCQFGEFETRLSYGLLPETEYRMEVKLTDTFNQSASSQLSFKTSPPKEQYTRFHNLQQQYNVTTPDKTKFTYAVENLEYLDLHICKLSPEVFLERSVYHDSDETPARSDGCTEVISKQILLPVRYWVNNYFQVNLSDYFTDTRGHYVLTFSHPLYKDSYTKKQMYDRTYVSVTNLAVGKKEVEYYKDGWSLSSNPNKDKVLEEGIKQARNLYWVNNSKTLAPALGAIVTQYERNNSNVFTQRNSAITDVEGIAKAPVQENLVGAVIRSGLDTAVVNNWADTLMSANQTQDTSKTYVYTDRPIYRPGHTVNIRGIDRIGFDGVYEVWNKEKVLLEIFDSQGARVYDTVLEQSLYGTFATKFELPSDAPLGSYRIEVFNQSFYFDVEEYVGAAFKLEAETNKEEYINGDTFKLDVQADYYFGVPLDEGTVSYSVTAQDYYFDKYTDDYFNFGNDWYYCYYCGYGDNFLFRGQATINENGKATIEKKINLADYFEEVESEGSKIFTVSVTAKDINGRAVSLQKSFVVHRAEFYLGLKTDQYYTGVNSPNTLRVKTVDIAGKPITKSDIEKVVYKVEWETFKRQEVDGGFYYRSEKKLTEVSREKIKTDGNGDWNGSLVLVSEGQYEVQVTSDDDKGNTLKTTTNVYIYGTGSVTVPPNNNYELDLEVEKSQLKVGDTASLLIKSPYLKAKALITIERGSVYDYSIVDVVGGLYSHQFPIKNEYAPNVYVTVLLLSPDPEVKYGNTYYSIGTTEKELTVEVKSDKINYLPGEEVKLTVATKNNLGAGVPAEVSIAVADLSVLALKGNPKKNPLIFFYSDLPLSVSTASNIKNILYEVDVPLGTKGGGGASPDDLTTKKRGLFKDTAFWSAEVETNQAGEASVSFTLPDNLTTWQIEALGVTRDTKFGVDYKEFTTKKDLMAVPLKPRFVVPGDEFLLGAKIFNQSEKGSEISVTLESSTLEFTGNKNDSVFINPGETKTVYFSVKAPSGMRAGEHKFTFNASGNNFVDSVEQTIAITANTTYETVATANATKDDTAIEYLYVPSVVEEGEGGLTINANATMAVFMTDALSYMVTYPYGCSEQLASSLSTIGILTEALTLPNVEGELDTIDFEGVTYTVDTVVTDGLKRIYEAQTIDGGFAYYKGMPNDLLLTIHVLSALYDLKVAGYEINEDVLARGLRFVEANTLEHAYYGYFGPETVILAEHLLRKVSPDTKTSLTDYVIKLIKDESFINEKISSMSLAYLAILTASDYSKSDREKVYKAFINRIDIDGRGAYLASTANANYGYYETPIKNTALALAAFAAHEDRHETLPNMLRWLLASRDNKGVWGSTQNTFTVVSAMVGYLKWQHETEAHFTLRGLLDNTEIFDYEFNPKNVFETFTRFVGIDELPKDKLLPLALEKEDKNGRENNLYYDMALKYYLPTEALPPRDEGITITRDMYALDDEKEKNSLSKAKVGDVVKGKLVLTIPQSYTHLAVEDFIPAGFEIVNFNLSTEDQSLNQSEDAYYDEWSSTEQSFMANVFSSFSGLWSGSQTAQVYGQYNYGGSYGESKRTLYPTHTESHDDRVFLYVSSIEPGVYEYEYFLRALVPGTFQHLPARAEQLYFPEVFGRTSGDIVTVTAD